MEIDEATGAGSAPIVLRVAIEAGPSDGGPAGTIGADGAAPPVPFHGWVELMLAITEASAAPR